MLFNKVSLCNVQSGNLGPVFEERAGLVDRTEGGCCFGLGRFQPPFFFTSEFSGRICPVYFPLILSSLV